mmetsp:Transcript_66189/g.149428  ORF Transcript_66189/g.149428 Transcript_66189/m.149428 type:complete len:200 (-) Transcript_66189:198-797(-)
MSGSRLTRAASGRWPPERKWLAYRPSRQLRGPRGQCVRAEGHNAWQKFKFVILLRAHSAKPSNSSGECPCDALAPSTPVGVCEMLCDSACQLRGLGPALVYELIEILLLVVVAALGSGRHPASAKLSSEGSCQPGWATESEPLGTGHLFLRACFGGWLQLRQGRLLILWLEDGVKIRVDRARAIQRTVTPASPPNCSPR